ncbi:alanine racemase [Alloscardovia theropitheci]|uniref:Alanine racemase n=1 Tax=Alloscardovia theropitheci TaxID=2496842 RepID=A0A4R0QRI9_9BIFI|nr:alanine racemase [Alloscardovia theropitheci]TCD54973.1 alanine racemase [Alloscardovia theropitheci]
MTLTAVDLPQLSDAGQSLYEDALKHYPAQALVRLDTLASNMSHMVHMTAQRAMEAGVKAPEVMGVVKADAYGHGLVPTALAALAGGATWLGTAQAREALNLRHAGITPERAHILAWMFSAAMSPFDELIHEDIDIAVGSLRDIERVALAAHMEHKRARVHVQLETGFGRNGFTRDDLPCAIEKLVAAHENGLIDVIGVMSHLAVADAPNSEEAVDVTNMQIANFNTMVETMQSAGIHPEVRHLANTAATLTRPEIYYDLVRPGIGLYGYEPDTAMGTPGDYGITPAMTLQAQLGTIKDLPAGHGISYGRTYITEHDTSTADMPVGYADGIHRSASGFNPLGSQRISHMGGPVKVRLGDGNSKIVHISGRVCMDQSVLDLHGNAEEMGIHEGDTVLLFGPGRGAVFGEPTADDWARSADTISYEIFTCLRNRIPRLYLGAHEVLSESDISLIENVIPGRVLS